MRTSIPSLLAACLCAAAIPAQDLDEASDATRARLFARARQAVGTFQQQDGTVEAEGPSHRSSFTASGVAFSVPAQDAGGELPTLSLRYLGAARVGRGAALPPARTPELSGDRVIYRHADVVEAYALQRDGFEQTFELAAPPAGTGDLVLTIGVGGNVHAEPAAPLHRALEFRFADRPAIRYGEAFVYDRTGTRVDVRTAYDGAGRITLTVPAAFLDEATYPVVVDPVVTPVFLTAASNWMDVEPDVAYQIENDVYMVTWRRVLGVNSEGVRGQLFESDGTPITGFFSLTSGANGVSGPTVAPCNRFAAPSFLVVWEQGDTIRGRLVDATNGAMLAAEFVISTPATGEADGQPTVSGPGDGAMMVAWARTASGGTNPNRILFRHLQFPNTGVPSTVSMSNEETIMSVSSGYLGHPRLARSDVRNLVGGTTYWANRLVWHRFWTTPAPGDFDCYTASFRVRYSPFTFQFVQPPSLVPGADQVGPDEFRPDIGGRATLWQVGNDVQYLVAWEDEGDVLGRMYDLNGPIGSTLTIQDDSNIQGSPAVGAGFCEFSVAYLEVVPPNEFDVSIKAARVLLDGTVAVTDRLVDDPGGQFQNGVRASSRPIHDQPADQTNRVVLGWMGETGPAGGLQDVRCAFFEPVDVDEFPFGSACPAAGGQLAAIASVNGPAWAGNDDFGFTVSGAPPFTVAALLISDQLTVTPIPGAPGCSLYAGLPLISVLATATDGSGFGSVGVPIPCSIPSGTTLAFQWAIYAPTANPFGWVVSSDIDVSWSHL